MRKNVASQVVAFSAISATDGSAVTSGTPTVYYTIDGGTQGTGTATPVHEGNGQWSWVPTQSETNGNHIAYTFVLAGCIIQTLNVYTVSFDPHDTVRLGITALPNAAADAAGGLVISDLGGFDIDGHGLTVDGISADTDAILADIGTIQDLGSGATIGDNLADIESGIGGTPLDAAGTAAAVWNAATASYGSAGSYGLLIETNLDAAVSSASAPSAADVADAVWDEAQSGHVGAGTFGEIATEIASILVDTAEIGAAGAGLTEAGGTGDHLTAVPWNTAWAAPINAEVDASIVTYGLDHLVQASVTGTDIANDSIIAQLVSATGTADWDDFDNTTDSLQALADSGGGGPTAAQIADAVWTEAIADHSATSGSTAESLAAAGGSGDPWVTALPGSYTGSQAGKILADILADTAAIPAFPSNFADLAITASTGLVDINGKTGFSLASGGLAAVATWTVDITGSLSGSVGSVTGNVGGNVVGSVANVTGGINTAAGTITTLDGLDTAQDNQHAATQSAISTNQSTLLGIFPPNFTDMAITETTGRVTVGTNADKTGYTLTVTPPTATQIRTEMDSNSTQLTAIAGVTEKLDTALEDDGAAGYQFTTLALDNAPGGGGGGGDATAANQTIIITHLTDIKGAGWSDATDTLEDIRDAIAGVGGAIGPGSIEHTITVLSEGDPVDGAQVWVSTDEDGVNVIAGALTTDAFGEAVFMLDAGDYYQWAQKTGVNFTNPTSFTVS